MIRSRASQRGFSLATTLILVALVGGIASALIILSTNQMGVDQKTRDKIRATYLAEAAVEQMAFILRQAHANSVDLFNSPGFVYTDSQTGVQLTCEDRENVRYNDVDKGRTLILEKNADPNDTWPPDGKVDTVSAVVTINDQRIQLLAELFMQRQPARPPGNEETGVADADYDPSSLTALTTTKMYSITGELRYLGRAETAAEKLENIDATLRRVRGATLGRVVRVMEFQLTPIFDKFAFWNGDMEVLPGPRAIFNGRLHTNGNLHIGSGGGLDINTDYIRARKEVYRHRLDNPGGSSWANVTIRDRYKDPHNAQGQLGDNDWEWKAEFESDSKYNSSWDVDKNWLAEVNGPDLSGKIRNSDNESDAKLTLTPPEIQSKNPDGHYHQTADIVIQDDRVLRKIGESNGKPVHEDITSLLAPGTVTTSTIYDAREVNNATGKNGADVPVTVVDMSLLQKSGAFPSNGVVYAYRTNTKPASGSSPRVIEGIQIKNGQTLQSDLTFVTNGPAYVTGNFNMDIPDTANPPKHANTSLLPGDTTAVPSLPRKGAAVIADAVNLLSEGWNNTKNAGNPKPPSAKETDYNFALVTGNVPTVEGKSYSGGLENLPRFHENWGGVNCNYKGSLMCLWESEIATGKWGAANVYSPPNRNWDFDANFGDPDAGGKPPLFPQTVNISRTTYVEDYPVPATP